MRCSQCGTDVPDDVRHCPECGTRISLAVAAAEGPQAEVAPLVTAEDAGDEEGPPLGQLLMGSGLLGVLYGGAVGLVLITIAFVTGAFAEGETFLAGLPVAAALAAVAGAIVGMVAAITESVPGGVACAVIIDGVLRLIVLHTSGFWWGLTPGGLAATVASSILLGWLVSHQVVLSLRSDATS